VWYHAATTEGRKTPEVARSARTTKLVNGIRQSAGDVKMICQQPQTMPQVNATDRGRFNVV